MKAVQHAGCTPEHQRVDDKQEQPERDDRHRQGEQHQDGPQNHIEQAKEQISRTPYELPTVKITERNWYMHEAVKEHLGEKTLDEKLKSYRPDCFELIGYESHPKIKAPLSN